MKVTGNHVNHPAPAGVVDGRAWFELFHAAEGASRVSVLHVHFEPGSRTRWHTHPLGQTLIVTAGGGWVQSRGWPPQRLEVGDVVRIEPGEEHWHGARSDSAMSHVAVQESRNQSETHVLEPVDLDEQPTTKESFA